MKTYKAFTLAEVLITLGVIGVVAAITLPSFMENVTERINSERQANIAQKITQGMEHMRAHGLLNTQYSSTENFVDELQKYLKIAKRCDSEHVAECWPTDTVTMSDGEEFEVSKAKKGKNLSLTTETNNVGLILADGASIILNYNPASETIDVGTAVYEFPEGGKSLPVGGGKTKQFPYTTTVTGAIDFVMDVNGGKSPNSEVATRNRDIRSFKIAKFSEGTISCSERNGFEVPDVGCVVNVGTDYEPVTEGTDYIAWYDAGCDGNTSVCSSNRKDYWSGAKNKCTSLNGMHMPSPDELKNIYNHNCTNNHQNCISEIPTSGMFWGNNSSGGVAYDGWMSNGMHSWYYMYNQLGLLCVAD